MRVFEEIGELSPVHSWLLEVTLGGAVLMSGLFALRLVAGKWLPVSATYVAGLLILVRLLIPITLQSNWSLFALPSPVHHGTSSVAPSESVVNPAPHLPQEPSAPIGLAEIGMDSGTIVVPSKRARWTSVGVLSGLWVGGIGISVAIALFHYIRLRRWLGKQRIAGDKGMRNLVERCAKTVGLRKPPKCYVVDDLTTAAVFGIFRPVLLLPRRLTEKLSTTCLEHVVLHELTHIRRRDPLVGLLVSAARAVHWFNPLVWMTTRQLLFDREVLCDLAVTGRLDQSNAHDYAETLVTVLELSPKRTVPAGALLPFLTSKEEIKRRLTMITNPISTYKKFARAAGYLAIATVIGAGFTFAAAPDDGKERDREQAENREREEEREATERQEKERQLEREKAEHREREQAEQRERELKRQNAEHRKREDAELREREQRERELKREKSEHRKREEVEIRERERQEKSEKAERREREQAERREAIEKEVAGLRERFQHLITEGRHDEAKHLEDRIQQLLGKKGGENEEDLRRNVAELTEVMREMQRSMKEMRAEMRELRAQVAELPGKPKFPEKQKVSEKRKISEKEEARRFMHGFRGIFVGELLKKDLDGGNLAVRIHSIRKTWEQNKAKNSEKAKGQVWQIRGVSGKWMDILRELEIGERIEVEAFHNEGDHLDFVGERLRRADEKK